MICPVCQYDEAEEVALFSSVEIKCGICTIRKEWNEQIKGSGEWKTPIFTNDVKVKVTGNQINIPRAFRTSVLTHLYRITTKT